jgi:hypothetical protein
LKITVEVVNIYKAVILIFRKNFTVLPGHQVAWSVCRTDVFWWNWTKEESVEPTVIDPVIFLGNSIEFGEWW